MTRPALALSAGALCVALGAAVATPAHATEGLAWQWDDTPRTYHIRGEIRLSRFIFFNAFNNIDVRLIQARMELVTTCKANEPIGKKGWEVHCTIDDISIQGACLPGDEGRLDAVTNEWDDRLTGKVMELQFLADGRIRNVGFESITRRNRRDGENIERVRQLMTRMYSPLDMRLPKNGNDKGLGTWAQNDALLLGFTSSTGTRGAADVTHQITRTKGDRVKITSTGKGTIGDSDSALKTAGQEAIDFYEMEVNAEATFDIGGGYLIKRQAAVSGLPTASSRIADGTAGIAYIQAYAVDLVRGDTPPPELPPSKEIPRATQ